MLELTFTLTVFAAWIASVCLHEFGHAIVAYWGGDTSVKEKGYLTLNPLKYTDVNLSIVMPLFFLLIGGIPLPGAAVYINHGKLRSRFWKSAVSAAGPIMTLLFAIALAVILQIGWPDLGATDPQEAWLGYALALLLVLEIAAAVLNLLPVPPLDGYGILEPWLPSTLQTRLRKFGRFGIVLVFAALWLSPEVNQAFWGIVFGVGNQLGVQWETQGISYAIFRQGAFQLLIPVIIILVIVGQINRRRGSTARSSAPAYSAEELEDQLEMLDDMVEANPKNITAWYRRGLALANLQRTEEALASFQKAVELKSNFWEVWHIMGILQYRLQRYQEALNSVDQALHVRPKNPELQYLKGNILNSLSQYDSAIALFDQVLAKEPRNVDALMDKGSALYFSQQYESAIAVLDQVLELDPQNANAYFNRACCYAKLGQIQPGLDSIHQAVQYGDASLHQTIQTDPDLNPLRSNPNFPTIQSERN